MRLTPYIVYSQAFDTLQVYTQSVVYIWAFARGAEGPSPARHCPDATGVEHHTGREEIFVASRATNFGKSITRVPHVEVNLRLLHSTCAATGHLAFRPQDTHLQDGSGV